MIEGASEVSHHPHPAIEVRNLRVDLPRGGDIVDDVSFSIQAGEVLGLVGESGSGKTTVGMSLLGFARGGARITRGTAFVDGSEGINLLSLTPEQGEKIRGKVVAYVPQDPASALNPALRLRLQLGEIIEFHEPETSETDKVARIAQAMADVGLPSTEAFLDRFPHQLSGGQQQRIGIAMAVIMKPRVIVLDEPTTGLDVTTQNRILDVIKRLCRDHGIGALHVTHDLSVVAHVADRAMVMYSGRVVEIGPAAEVLRHPRHPYTQALLGAVPHLDRRNRLVTMIGQTAGPDGRTRGSDFDPRGGIMGPDGKILPAALQEVAPGHFVRQCKAGAAPMPAPVYLPDPTPAPSRGTTANTVVQINGLHVSYGEHRVLEGVDFTVERGECLAIVGESGSGKSTLSRALIGLVPQQGGRLLLNFDDLAPRARDRRRDQLQAMQYIFQSPHNSLNPRQRVRDLVGLVYDVFRRGSRRGKAAAVQDALAQVGLAPGAAEKFPDQMSGGERQRVSIARALMADPQVLICDEITSALDVSVQAAIVNLLKELQRSRNLTMLFVTHNLPLVRNIADRVLVLNKGKVAELGPVGDVIDHPRHPYSKMLLQSARETEPARRESDAATADPAHTIRIAPLS